MITEMVIRVFNMSFAAGCTACLVILLRRLLRRMPKGYSYALWLPVLFRFLCPFVIHAPVSLLPVNPEPVQQEIAYQADPEIQTGVIWVDRAVNGSVMEALAPESPVQSVNPIQVVLALAGAVWVIGMAAFLLYHLAQYGILKRRLSTAVRMPEYEEMADVQAAGNQNKRKILAKQIPVRVSDRIDGAFVFGIFHPVIYLPVGMEEEAVPMILRHEMVHACRRDGLMKLFWLAAVMIHWFNPLAWLSFRLMCADMEMSCDEQALRHCSMEERKDYSRVLLAEAERRSRVLLPLAFGKHSAYRRIQNILSYRRPKRAVLVLCGILLAAAGVSLMVSPKADGSDDSAGAFDDGGDTAVVSIIGGADGPTSIFLAGKLGNDSGDGSVGDSGISKDGFQLTERPDSQWLASQRLGWRQFQDKDFQETGEEERNEAEGENAGSDGASTNGVNTGGANTDAVDTDAVDTDTVPVHNISIDLATEDTLIFHGDFGLFAFERNRDGYWKQNFFLSDTEAVSTMTASLEKLTPEESGMSEDSVHREDRFIKNFDSGILSQGQDDMLDYAVNKMADGRITILGANPSGTVEGRLIDLWYGYYDPDRQVMTQVYLFLGDGKEFENYPGDIAECRYLFSRDDYDYFLRTPQSFLEFEQPEEGKQRSFHLPYDRLELVRSRNTGDQENGLAGEEKENQIRASEEVLDPLVCIQIPEHQRIVLTEDRIVYTAAADASSVSLKTPGLVSIRLDGSDRRIAKIPYQVYRNLSYEGGYLYYEGWTNDGAFPRPLYRMKPDFTEQEKVGEVNP